MIFRRFPRTGFSLLGAMFICMVFATSASVASGKGDIFTRFKKPMPKLTLLSNEEFIKVTKPIKKKPYGQDVLAYTMRIPKVFKQREDKSSSNFLLSEKLFLELSVFYGKATASGRSRIEIHALNLEGNLTAEQWYLKYILEGGYITEGFVTHSKSRVESLVVVMEKDASFYLRTVILLNGDKVIMVKYYVPTHYMNEQAAMQEQILKSFILTHKVKKTQIPLNSYRFLDIAELKYPETWKSYAKPLRSIDRMDVTLLNLKEFDGMHGKKKTSSTEGKMDITLVAATIQGTLIDEIKKYKQKMEASGMLIGDKLDIEDDFTYDSHIDFALTEVYEGVDSSNNLTEYEFWFTVMVGGNYYYFLTLLTPSRNERFGVWASNTQNYKIILSKFYPMAGAFMERDY